eukprot:TRINITY_DN4310_c0_g3_i1.p1 TRINITY_DN4310_c0_g3~~TRINITY_DN4310_c0_g3_i1.p1  ORF type:complete len:661 (-),score=127.32 TRINITY_DN4310_c0_g3_i1:65-2047(-)
MRTNTHQTVYLFIALLIIGVVKSEQPSQCTTTCQEVLDGCDNRCSVYQNCVQKSSGWVCLCKPGFAEDGSGGCVDIDECGSNPCHNPNAYCDNYPGGFHCRCKAGFEGDGVVCIETSGGKFSVIRETEAVVDSRQTISIDLIGPTEMSISSTEAHTWTDPGYQAYKQGALAPLRINVTGITAEMRRGVPNTYRIYYTAVDEMGIRSDTKVRIVHVTWVSPCKTGTHTCSEFATCIEESPTLQNERGYRCECKTGYEGNGFSCRKLFPCKNNADCHKHAFCKMITDSYCETQYECVCDLGWVGDGYTCTRGPDLWVLLPELHVRIPQCGRYIEPGWEMRGEAKQRELNVFARVPPNLASENILDIGHYVIKYDLYDSEINKVIDTREREVTVYPINQCVLPEGHPCRHKCNEMTVCKFHPELTTAPTYSCECPPGFRKEIKDGLTICVDSEPPTINLHGLNPVILKACKVCSWEDPAGEFLEWRDGGFYAYDITYEGQRINLTDKVITTGPIYESENVSYVLYDVSDEAGNKAVTQKRYIIKEVEDVHTTIQTMKMLLEDKYGKLEHRTESVEAKVKLFDILGSLLRYAAFIFGIFALWILVPKIMGALRVAYAVHITHGKVTLDEFLEAYDLWYMFSHPTWSRTKRQRVAHQSFQKLYYD